MPARRTSAVLKLLNGSAQHDPGRLRDESRVAPKDRVPGLPDGLLDAQTPDVQARYAWLVREYCLAGVHGRPDGLAILMLAQTMIDRDLAYAKVAEFGQVMKHPRTNKPMLTPFFSALSAKDESVRRQMNELGFTPVGRLRHAPLKKDVPPAASEWDAVGPAR